MERITWAPSTTDARQQQVIESSKGPYYITTFRKGTKWLRPELVGQRVELFDEVTQRVFSTAKVVSVKYAQFEDLTVEDYYGQPTANISAYDMLDQLKKVYGGEYDTKTGTTVVTLDEVKLV